MRWIPNMLALAADFYVEPLNAGKGYEVYLWPLTRVRVASTCQLPGKTGSPDPVWFTMVADGRFLS